MTNRQTTNKIEVESRAAVDPRISIFLVTGSASSAKAAVLLRLARGTNRNMAFALSETHTWRQFSSGAETISSLPDIARMQTGNICVDAKADPVNALYQLHLRRLGLLKPPLHYDAVVVEVGDDIDTGSFVAVVQNDTRIDVTYRVAGIIHAVDVSDRPFRSRKVQLSRIGEADTIILTKVCESEADKFTEAVTAISSANPLASVLTLDVFDQDSLHPFTPAPADFWRGGAEAICRKNGMVRLPGRGDAVEAIANNLYSDPYSNDHTDAPLSALKIHLRGEADLPAVMRVVGELCAAHRSDLLRLAAVLNVRHADHPIALDVIGGTLLHPAFHSNVRRTGSDVCILAHGLDASRTLDAFGHCGRKARVQHAGLHAVI